MKIIKTKTLGHDSLIVVSVNLPIALICPVLFLMR